MWCRECKIETLSDKCPICGQETEINIPTEVHWCGHCNIPIICKANEKEKSRCPLCNSETKYISTDLRPVFPQERLLLELMWKMEPNSLADKSIWANNSRCYINGKAKNVTAALYKKQDINLLRQQLEKYEAENNEAPFQKYIDKFVEANKQHLAEIIDEAHSFIRNEAELYII